MRPIQISTKASNPNKEQLVSSEPSELLIVEDSILIQYSLDEMLNKLGHSANFARTGKQAIKLYQPNYKLILMDIELPDMNGIEVTKEIRKIERKNQWAHVPIIAVTSHYDDPTYQEQCLSAGMNGFSNKPSFSELKALLTHFLIIKNSH